MRSAHPGYDDEIGFAREVLGTTGPASEFNILDEVWNARVTSHMPLSAVAVADDGRCDRAMRSSSPTRAMREAGFASPRIAVAGLNPHAGDGGNFGREEIDVIAPAVEAARATASMSTDRSRRHGVRARQNGNFDAVVTMYHDQGQIAMKLMGFDRGVTLIGGFPFPICTPAHGTAYDIAGRASPTSAPARAALLLATRMGAARRAKRQTTTAASQ